MQDPLSFEIETQGVDTSFPLLPDGDYGFQITASEPKQNKKQTGYNWNLTLSLLSPAISIDNKEIKAGSKFTFIVALQPSEQADDPEGYKRMIASAQDAIFGTNQQNRPKFSKAFMDACVGKTVLGHIIIDTYEGVKNNKIKRLKSMPAGA